MPDKSLNNIQQLLVDLRKRVSVLEKEAYGGFLPGGSGSGGGAGDSVKISVSQTSHGFSDGEPIYFNGTNWASADASTQSSLGTHLAEVVDTDNFDAVQSGKLSITAHGFGSAGDWLFVSETAGTLTTTEPSTFSNPIAQVIDTDTIYVFSLRATGSDSRSQYIYLSASTYATNSTNVVPTRVDAGKVSHAIELEESTSASILYTDIAFPSNYTSGSIDVYVYWGAEASSGDCPLDFRFNVLDDGGSFDASNPDHDLDVTLQPTTTRDIYKTLVGSFTPSQTAGILQNQIRRDANSGDDTINASLYLLGMELQYS